MTRQKIKHPFHVPDDFFESFGPEMLNKINNEPAETKNKSLIFTIMKYAAIVAISFLLGRISNTLTEKAGGSPEKKDLYSVDVVYSQVSEDDIDDFFLENATSDLLK